MKNITISIDDETHKAARIYAAASGTSVSALVKQYLADLILEKPVDFQGVRDMAVGYTAQPNLPLIDGPLPLGAHGLTSEGKPYFTKDGKPRKPGAMRQLGGGWSEDFDGWPDGFLDAVYGDDTLASNTWWHGTHDVLGKTGKE